MICDTSLHSELDRLARFGANISDAHSCFVFLPTRYPEVSEAEDLELVGVHSLSNAVIPHCCIPRGSGLVGWVAKHQRSIHVSPFERDSRTLGTYSEDQSLKSFIGIPVSLFNPAGDERTLTGVIACDSKKAFAFSKLQGKLLEELALEITHLVELSVRVEASPEQQLSWSSFLKKGELLGDALGSTAIEAMRLKLLNFDSIESSVGIGRAIELVDQIFRLIQQALPPHFPVYRMPSGEILILLDNMMTSFFQSRIEALCQHINPPIRFSYTVRSVGDRRQKALRNPSPSAIESLIADTAVSEVAADRKTSLFEFRRA